MFRIDWDMVVQLSTELAKVLQSKRIYPVARSGLIICGIMSHHNCKLAGSPEQADWVVDDIADTGQTLAQIRRVSTAALVIRDSCATIPTHYVMKLYTSDYILFPWEDEAEAQKKIDAGISFRDKDR